MSTRAVVVSSVVLALVASGCSSDGAGDDESPRAASTPGGSAASAPSATGGELDESFLVGEHELHLSCFGDGSSGAPTIVYLHGLGGQGSDVHEALAPELTERARLCTYDRA